MSDVNQMAIAHIYGMNHQKEIFKEILGKEQDSTGSDFILYSRILELLYGEQHPPKRFRDVSNGE